jgi:hypothetical protein
MTQFIFKPAFTPILLPAKVTLTLLWVGAGIAGITILIGIVASLRWLLF